MYLTNKINPLFFSLALFFDSHPNFIDILVSVSISNSVSINTCINELLFSFDIHK